MTAGITEKQTCETVIDSVMASTMLTLSQMLEAQDGEAHEDHEDEYDEDSFSEYGLDFSYVRAGTFDDQTGGYFRYQMSWGGPSDELRFYVSPGRFGGLDVYKTEYVYMDWFDGASRRCYGADLTTALDVLAQFDHGNLAELVMGAEDE